MFDLTQSNHFKRLVRASFDRTDPQYGTQGDFHWQFAARLIDRAPLQEGQVILDVATGTAPAAILAAARVGATGHIFGLDLSVGILKLAQRNFTDAHIATVSLLCADAEYLPLRASCIDGILCSSSIVWLPGISHALHDWYRVLAPHGWVAFSCFGGLARQTINDLLLRVLVPYGITYPNVAAALNNPEKCQVALQDAGFTRITVHTGYRQQLTTDPEISFAQARGISSRLGIQIPAEQVMVMKTAYIAAFTHLLQSQAHWNEDYEQFVIAYKQP